MSSVAGLSAHANYSAANAVLDGFALDYSATGMHTYAVQWGAWASVGERHVGTCIEMRTQIGSSVL